MIPEVQASFPDPEDPEFLAWLEGSKILSCNDPELSFEVLSIARETDKAWFVSLEGFDEGLHWWPKKSCRILFGTLFYAPEWLVKQKYNENRETQKLKKKKK